MNIQNSEQPKSYFPIACALAVSVGVVAGVFGVYHISETNQDSLQTASLQKAGSFFQDNNTVQATSSLSQDERSSKQISHNPTSTQPGMKTYKSELFGFSFSYPRQYPDLHPDGSPEADRAAGIRRYYPSSQSVSSSQAIPLWVNQKTSKAAYPTIHLRVTSLDNYFYRDRLSGTVFAYDAETQSWQRTSPLGENRQTITPDTVSVGQKTGYKLRVTNPSVVYDVVAVPYPKQGVMIELGMGLSPSTTQSIAKRDILQSFQFSTR